MVIPPSFVSELLSRVDVVEVVGKYVQLKKGGANFMGLCPFHGEKSPSFSVSPSKQFFHCFGCGKSGDAIAFLMEHCGMSFIEAVKDLAQQTGMQVPEEPMSPQERARAAAAKAKSDSLSEVLEKAGQAYREHLKSHERATDYLKQRGLSGQIAKRFGLGYAPEGWRSLASVFAQYDDPLLVEAGLVIVHEDDDKRYDRFRDRIMFPIRNVKGECIGFGGRVIGQGTPKYLNSPETPVFHKGRELYGLFEAREALHSAGYVLVTEGYMDVVALAQWGFANAVATLGTACTPEHVQKLFRFTDSVVFGFDGDAAGRRAARKALEGALPYASDTRSIKFLFLPPEHDPDSYVREFGQEGFARQIREAMPLSRFLIEVASADCDVSSAEGRARMSSQAQPLWQLLPEGAFKQQLLVELARSIGLDAASLQHLWQQAADSKLQQGAAKSAQAHSVRTAGGPVADASVGAAYAAYATPAQDAYPYPSHLPPSSGWRREPYSGSKNWGQGKRFGERWNHPPPPFSSGPRTLPASRADHAARLLLANMALWDHLAGEDQAMLCALAAPHGALFVWLESQYHEHGPLGWSALVQEMQGQPFAEHAQRWMLQQALHADTPAGDSPDVLESRQELRRLLDLMQIDRLKQLETEALAQAQSGQDPEALQRYKSLHERRRQLIAQSAAASS